MPNCYRQLRVMDLPKVFTWRREWSLNLRPSGCKAPNLPPSHHVPQSINVLLCSNINFSIMLFKDIARKRFKGSFRFWDIFHWIWSNFSTFLGLNKSNAFILIFQNPQNMPMVLLQSSIDSAMRHNGRKNCFCSEIVLHVSNDETNLAPNLILTSSRDTCSDPNSVIL